MNGTLGVNDYIDQIKSVSYGYVFAYISGRDGGKELKMIAVARYLTGVDTPFGRNVGQDSPLLSTTTNCLMTSNLWIFS